MTTYILRKILQMPFLVIGTCFILFVIFNVIPGQDPAIQLAGRHATPDVIASIRHELGLDQSLPMQFLTLLKQTATFDFGRSYATKQRISDMIIEGAGPSFSLVAPPFVISVLIGVLVGMLVAVWRGRPLDKFAVAICVALQSISLLVYIIYGQYFMAYKWGLFPISGYDSSWSGRWQYLVLPGLIYIVLGIAPEIRFYRTAFLDELYQDYVRTAKAKGLNNKAILFKHVLKNAMVPILTDLIINIPYLILGALVLESFFGIPGLGDLTVRSIANNDRPVLIAITVVGTIAFIIFSLLTDVMYGLFDPRVKLE